jgi:hypothetical protein
MCALLWTLAMSRVAVYTLLAKLVADVGAGPTTPW